jgi:4-hydroxythreonine-4-phosphate dehydrogenase
MPRILITLGDPAGIGPEVIDHALIAGGFPADCSLEVIGDRRAGTPGRADERSARAAWEALDQAVGRLKEVSADAVVTGPVSKQGLQRIGFEFPGQTEYFAHAFGVEEYGMLLTGRNLTVGLATIHEPLAAVPALLSEERIIRIARLTHRFLEQRRKPHPRIAVAGLNPHAGENGTFGDEESRIIAPALERLHELYPGVFSGPAVPDAVFRDAVRGSYDAVIAMYHDQALIPLKLLDFETAANVTLGLPVPRTSPDHGTAFDLVGTGRADASSMRAAIWLACELAGTDGRPCKA